MRKNSKLFWYIIMVLGCLLVIFGGVTLLKNINYHIEQKREKEALIGLFYDQSLEEVISGGEPGEIPEESDIVIEGDTIGIIKIPSMKLVAPIGFGVTDGVLRKQVGMYTTTDKFITVGGNTGLAAHTSFKNGCSYCYFYKIRDIELGDMIYVDYKDKKTYKFKVIEIMYDEAIEADIPYVYKKEGSALITLSTCSDYGDKRDFVVAEYVGVE